MPKQGWGHAAKVAAVMVVIGVGFFSGIAYADFTVGGFGFTSSQGGASVSPVPPVGVTFTSAFAKTASGTTPTSTGKCAAADSSTNVAPDAMVGGSTIWMCVNGLGGGYAASHMLWTETITFGVSAPVATTYEFDTNFVFQPGNVNVHMTAYAQTPGSSATSTIMMTYDMTFGGQTGVTSSTVIVSQCAGSVCP